MSQPFDAVTITLELQGSQPLTVSCLAVLYQAKIHAPYELKVQLALNDFDFAPNTPCQLKISTKQFQSFIFSGQLGSISEGTLFNLEGRLDWLTIVPDCAILYQQLRSGIYYDASILDVIERGLKTVALQKNLSAPESIAYPRQKSMTQYAEPDMAFIARQLAEYGIWYHFYQDFETGSAVTMRLGDHNQAFIDRGRVPILSDAQSEGAGLFDVEWNGIPLPDAVQGIHFVEEENVYLNSGEAGLQHSTLGNQLNQKQLDYLTAVAKAGIQVQQQILTASFQGLNLQPGEVIHIQCDDSPIAFVITEVYYDFSGQHRLKAAALMDLEGHPLTYRTPIWVDSQRVYPPPELTGILSGCYGLSDGEVVVPDALGNIPVYFPYDYEECCGNQIPARLTRMASWSNQGGQTGKTFPIYKDTELQVMFANGNMDYPLIKGAAANAETGHVHHASVNRRTHWQLPQGQHLSYSNVPGDDNFIHLGAAHTEDTHRSSILLTNYRDPDQPGTKRLDYQQSTTHSLERVTGQDYHSQQGGNLTVLDTAAKVNPMTYLVIQLTDQSNLNAPDKAPALKTYLKTLLLDFSLDQQGHDVPLSLSGLSVNPAQKFKLKQLLQPNVQADTLSQYGPLTLTLTHSSASTANQSDAVNVILLNGTPILPVNTLTLSSTSWQKNKTTDQWGNIYYTITLTVLAPSMLFNFRQDVYQFKKQLTGADLAAYPILLPYFEPDQDSLDAAQWMRDAFTEEELDFFISQGNNATFFIHGYNVGFGKARRPDDDISASAAHQWFRQMESHLNVAAGFDEKDYTKYTRLIGIAWQGDPSGLLGPANFRADYAMTAFPAEKLLTLLQQLSEKGIEVNIVAHSCGNHVLMQTLERAAAAGIKINHSFMWEPAIAQNAFDAPVNTLLPMEFQDPKTGGYVALPAPDFFPNAAKATDYVTVLYSDDDTILGNINATPSQKVWTAEAIHDFYIGLFGDGPLANVVKTIGSALAFSVESLLSPIWAMHIQEGGGPDDPTVGNMIHATKTDPGAGLFFAAPGEVMFLLDRYGMDHITRQLDLISIYHLANLFVEPLSFFLADSQNIQHFYNRWTAQYQTYILPQSGQNQRTVFAKDLQAQKAILSEALPEAYNLLAVGLYLTIYLKNGVGIALKSSIRDAIQSCVALSDWKNTPTPVFSAADEAGTQADLLATMMLSVILTDGAHVPPAMGYRGVATTDPFYNSGQYFGSSQKDPSGKDLCVDHSAMLFPTPEFMEYVYIKTLMHPIQNKEMGFQYFGKWKVG